MRAIGLADLLHTGRQGAHRNVSHHAGTRCGECGGEGRVRRGAQSIAQTSKEDWSRNCATPARLSLSGGSTANVDETRSCVDRCYACASASAHIISARRACGYVTMHVSTLACRSRRACCMRTCRSVCVMRACRNPPAHSNIVTVVSQNAHGDGQEGGAGRLAGGRDGLDWEFGCL